VNKEADRSRTAGASPEALHKRMMQLLSGLWVTHAVGTFARLGLADAIADGTETAAAIAAVRGLNADRVYRLLRALSTVGIVTEPTPGSFALTPLGNMLGARAPHSMRTAAMLLTEYNADIWRRLDEAVQGDGTAFEALEERPFFVWLAEHPGEALRFHRMMVEVHGPETPAIVAAYDFGRFSHVVDVGGGNGSLLSAILAAFPGLRATLFDLPEGIAAAKRAEGGHLPGATLVAGDVFSAVPEGGDLYLLRHVLHDFDDDACMRILANVRRAMRPNARVLVLEAPVPTDDKPAPGRWLDLHVMLLSGGRERTIGEYAALLARSGLRLARTIETAHPAVAVVEAVIDQNN